MSEPTLVPAETAFATVHQHVYCPVFFTKLARDYGIQPRPGTNDVVEMLEQAAILRQHHDAEIEKQAAAQPDLLSMGRNALQGLFGQQVNPADANEQAIKAAAVHGAQNPELARSILSLEAAIAQQQAAK